MVSRGEGPRLIVLGASGFLGRALLSECAQSYPLPVIAVSREPPAAAGCGRQVRWQSADLRIPGSLDSLLGAGDILCHLAYDSSAGESGNSGMMQNVIESCLKAQVARLVHCSTSSVAGAVRQSQLVESMASRPRTRYERTKWMLEQRVLAAVAQGLDAVILRPTQIVGPGGANLLKLARALQSGRSLANYLRASLYSRRAMHLVPVRNVAQALLHVAHLAGPQAGAIYYVSADDEPANNFRDVEATLRQALGLAPRRLPLLPVPSVVLAVLLRLLGRSDTDPARIYAPGRLRATGLQPVQSVLSAVNQFGMALRQGDATRFNGDRVLP